MVLIAIYALNVADRYLASTLMEPIKQEYGLSDSMVGFLTGTVLAIFFVLTQFPAGILADRFNRKRVVSVFAALFSLATIACGAVASSAQFAVARIAVGVAEAGTTPPSLSLLSDKFAASHRATVMTIFTTGAALGAALGSAAGGWLSDNFGWRIAFIVFGAAGFPLVLAAMVLIREPKRGALDSHAAPSTATVKQTLSFIWSQKALVHVILGGTVVTFWGWGLLFWAPAFFHRSFGIPVGDAGVMLASLHLVGGVLATLATAFVMRWLGVRDPRFQVAFIAIMVGLATIPSVLAFTANSIQFSMWMMWLFVPVAYLYFGPNFGMVNNLVPASMRGQAVAIYLIGSNFANLALAPQLVGWGSDFLAARGYDGAASLRTALVAVALTGFWGALHYVLAMRHLRHDLARVAKLS